MASCLARVAAPTSCRSSRSRGSDPYAALVDPARDAFQASYGTQPGDPYRAGQAIIAAVESDDPPMRLPLGADAFEDIRRYLQRRLAELGVLEPAGAGTDFD
jgi:hypothetical protein